MKTKIPLYLSLAALLVGSAHAALYINAGDTGTAAGLGPLGSNSNYLAYTTSHETATSGALQTFSGTSFSEGGLAGTYNVGVEFAWLDATSNAAKQAFKDRQNNREYAEFWRSWIGVDSDETSGTSQLKLSLSGLEANQAFTFTSYHVDSADQGATFTVDQTPSASETSTSPFTFRRGLSGSIGDDLVSSYAYSFDVTSDALGNLDVTYAIASGRLYGVNGFDLVAVPEPSTGLLAAFAASALFLRRRRA